MTQRRFEILTVVYDQEVSALERLVRSIKISEDHALSAGLDIEVRVVLGNCGAKLSDAAVNGIVSIKPDVKFIEFEENLGHSAGCNALVAQSTGGSPDDMFLFLNPDALLAPSALKPLVMDLSRSEVGAVDARQIPMEHPKYFDPDTRRQSWASGACLGTRREVFDRVGGFDPVNFWSYCNDVDLSWRIRLAGWQVVHVPDAVIFHDKRLSIAGHVEPTSSEVYFSTLGRLMLARRYGDQQVELTTLNRIGMDGTDDEIRAATEFKIRTAESRVPRELPDASTVAEFRDGEYGFRRF